MEGVQGYNKDQIALVVPDLLNFAAWVPIILGTPTISHVVNVIKEEIDALAMLWANAWVAHLLLVQRATATVAAKLRESPAQVNTMKWLSLKMHRPWIAFSSCVIPIEAEKVYTGERISVMTQAL